jgi:hypothetical protein
MKGLDDLENVMQHVHDSFKTTVAERDYTIYEGADPDQD